MRSVVPTDREVSTNPCKLGFLDSKLPTPDQQPAGSASTSPGG